MQRQSGGVPGMTYRVGYYKFCDEIESLKVVQKLKFLKIDVSRAFDSATS